MTKLSVPIFTCSRLLCVLLGVGLAPISPSFGQNQPPVLLSTVPDQIMDQEGTPVELDLTEFFSDPEVSSPAVQFDVTTAGSTQQIHFGFFADATPITTANFIAYIEAGRFLNNIIHRSSPNFVIQGGGFRFSGSQNIQDVPNFDEIQNEPGISNTRGTVAMAKRDGEPNSASSQWFINLKNNGPELDSEENNSFTVFARVLGNGMTVVDEIAALEIFNASNDLGGAFRELPLSSASLLRRSFVETDAKLISPVQFTASSTAPDVVSVSVDDLGQLTLNPSDLRGGESTITIEASDLDGAKIETSFAVTVIPFIETYAAWQTNINFGDEQNAARTADPDKDGWINLLEYAFGTDPLAATQTDSQFQALKNAQSTLAIREDIAAEIRVETSTNLKTWITAWQTSQGISTPAVVSYEASNKQVTATFRYAPLGVPPFPRYWRVVVVETDS